MSAKSPGFVNWAAVFGVQTTPENSMFEYVYPLQFNMFTPPHGMHDGGTLITLIGNNFVSDGLDVFLGPNLSRDSCFQLFYTYAKLQLWRDSNQLPSPRRLQILLPQTIMLILYWLHLSMLRALSLIVDLRMVVQIWSFL